MNRVMVARYRERVMEEDTCYFLGDLTIVGPMNRNYIESIVKQLPGRKILILGNHDKLDPFTYHDIGFHEVHTTLTVDIADIYNVHLCHDPAWRWDARTRLWLCGHIHGLFKEAGGVINVGVDVWDFYPVGEVELYPILNRMREENRIE